MSLPFQRIHALVIDSGPLIKNDPSIDTLLSQSDGIYTTASAFAEIRDAATRSRVELTLSTFLHLRTPKPENVRFVTTFAKKTGDAEVLSRTDVQLIALAYELECERNGGDSRLRKTPARPPPTAQAVAKAAETLTATPERESLPAESGECVTGDKPLQPTGAVSLGDEPAVLLSEQLRAITLNTAEIEEDREAATAVQTGDANSGGTDGISHVEQVAEAMSDAAHDTIYDTIYDTLHDTSEDINGVEPESGLISNGSDSESDWITPANVHQFQSRDAVGSHATASDTGARAVQVALLTSDFAMQNVCLQIGLDVLSPAMARITQVKTWVKRCHGCFSICRDMSRQFCPRCGQPTLTRVSCSTDEDGAFRAHLKRNFQWNKRGNVYALPKPGHGSPSGKASKEMGGGRDGWGHDLILTEDQKEYTRAVEQGRRTKTRDFMDEDYLPDILSGRRTEHVKIKIGAGRNVNGRRSRK